VCELLAFRLREEGVAVMEALAEKLKPKERDALIASFASGKEVRALESPAGMRRCAWRASGHGNARVQ
jgi:ATP-dependent RNA helicase DDX3X